MVSQAAGIKDKIGLKQLRHALWSHALMAGISPRTVQAWMGHQDLKITLCYAHLSPQHEQDSMQRLSFQADPLRHKDVG